MNSGLSCLVLFIWVIVFFVVVLSETGSCYKAQAGLELTFVAQAGLELTAILTPQPPECWDYRHEPPHQAFLCAIKAGSPGAGQADLQLTLCVRLLQSSRLSSIGLPES